MLSIFKNKFGKVEMTVLSVLFSLKSLKRQKGGFQLLDLILPELKSHVIPYKFKSSHWLKLQHSDWRANLVKDFFLTNRISTIERSWIFNRSCDFLAPLWSNLVTENPLKLMTLFYTQAFYYHDVTHQSWSSTNRLTK